MELMSLESDHSYVLNMAKEVLALRTTLGRKAARVRRFNTIKALAEARRQFREFEPNILMTQYRMSDEWRQQLENVATEQDKSNNLFSVVVTPYPLEGFAATILERLNLTHNQVEALLALHRAKRAKLLSFVPVKVLSIILAAGALVSKTVPKEAFESVGQGKLYGPFQFWVSIIVLLLLIYALALLITPTSQLTGKARREYQFCDSALEYASFLSLFNTPDAKPDASTPTVDRDLHGPLACRR